MLLAFLPLHYPKFTSYLVFTIMGRAISNSRKRRLYDLYTHAEFTKLEERFGEAIVFKKIEEEFGNKNRNRSVIDNISVNILKVGYQSVCC